MMLSEKYLPTQKVFYGNETKKALLLLGKENTPQPLIQAYGEVKLAAIRAQQETAHLYPDNYFPLLEKTAIEIIEGKYADSFPLPLCQGGAGTSIHMNICEVLCNVTNKKYEELTKISQEKIFKASPLDHLARFQSTNDTFPTAIIIMTYRFLESIEKKIITLQEQLVNKETQFEDIIICGRTELQDALPMTLGQVWSSWAGPIERDRWRFNKLKERLRIIPLGGTAIGTSFSAPRNYIFSVEKHLRQITKLPLSRSQNLCDSIANTDCLTECANGMSLCAENLYKMANDLLLYTSSVNGEFKHKEMQYGSTIMPDKTNPVILELIRGLCMNCSASAHLIAEYCKNGQWQLNANLPFIAEQFIRLDNKLEKVLFTATGPLMENIIPELTKIEGHLSSSSALINTLRDILPYSTIKKLLPEIKKNNPKNRNELINIITKYTTLDKKELHKIFNKDNLIGMNAKK